MPGYDQVWPDSHLCGLRWVDGELLRFASSNPATHGAELGFVWLVPQDKRYLVLLNKVELDDPMQDEEEEN